MRRAARGGRPTRRVSVLDRLYHPTRRMSGAVYPPSANRAPHAAYRMAPTDPLAVSGGPDGNIVPCDIRVCMLIRPSLVSAGRSTRRVRGRPSLAPADPLAV